jgi:hypothetical protein
MRPFSQLFSGTQTAAGPALTRDGTWVWQEVWK